MMASKPDVERDTQEPHHRPQPLNRVANDGAHERYRKATSYPRPPHLPSSHHHPLMLYTWDHPIDYTRPHLFQFSYSSDRGIDVHIPAFRYVQRNAFRTLGRLYEKVGAMCYPLPLSYIGLTWGLVLGYVTLMGDELDTLLLNPPDLPSNRQSKSMTRKGVSNRKSTNTSSSSLLGWISTSVSVLVSSASSIVFLCWYKNVLPFVRTVPLFPLLQRIVPRRYRVLVLLSILSSSGLIISTILHRFVVRQLLKYTNWYLETPVFKNVSEKKTVDQSSCLTVRRMFLRSPTAFYWFPVAKIMSEISSEDAPANTSTIPQSSVKHEEQVRAISGYSMKTRIWSFLSSIFLHHSIPCTEVYERCLPKQPLPSLEHTVQAYLEASQPLYWTSSGFSAATSTEVPTLITANAAKWLKDDEEREKQERSSANAMDISPVGQSNNVGNLSFGAPTPFGNSPAARNPDLLHGSRDDHFPLACSVVSSEWRQLCRLAANFLLYEGPLLQKQLKSLHRPWWTSLPWVSGSSSSPTAYHADANYVAEWWKRSVYLAARHPLPFTTNYTVNLFKNYKPTTHAISRAAVLTYLLGELQTQIKDRRVPPVFTGPEANIPVSMEQLFLAFYTTRIPGRAVDVLEHYKESRNFHNFSSAGPKRNMGCYFPSARYVVVIYKGFMYQMFLDHPSKNTSSNIFFESMKDDHESNTRANSVTEEEEEEDTMLSGEATSIRESNALLAKKHKMVPCTPRMLERSLEWIVDDVELKEVESVRRKSSAYSPDADDHDSGHKCNTFHNSCDINKSFPPHHQCPALVSLLLRATGNRRGLSTIVSCFEEERAEATESAFQPQPNKKVIPEVSQRPRHSVHPESPFASFLLRSNDPHALMKEEEQCEAQRLLPALTCAPRALWSDIREQYLVQDPVNCFPLKVVEQAMFVVSLDSLEKCKGSARLSKRQDGLNAREGKYAEAHASGPDGVTDISVSSLRSTYSCSPSTGDEKEDRHSGVVCEDPQNTTHVFSSNSPELSKSPNAAFAPLFSEPLGRFSADEGLLSGMNAPGDVVERDSSEEVRLSGPPHCSYPQAVVAVPPEIGDDEFQLADEDEENQGAEEENCHERQTASPLRIDVKESPLLLPGQRNHRKKSRHVTPNDAQDVFLSFQGKGTSKGPSYPHLWADKSIHLLVDRHGNAGFHVEASWGDPAVFQWIADYVGMMELKSATMGKDSAPDADDAQEAAVHRNNDDPSPLSALERCEDKSGISKTSPSCESLYYYTRKGYAARLEHEGDEPVNDLPFGIGYSELLPGKRRRKAGVPGGRVTSTLEVEQERERVYYPRSNYSTDSWWRAAFFSRTDIQDSLPTLLTPCRLSFRMHQTLVSAIQRAHFSYTNLYCTHEDEELPYSDTASPLNSVLPANNKASPEMKMVDTDYSPLSPSSSQQHSSPPPLHVYTLSFRDYGRSFIENALLSLHSLPPSSILRHLYESDSEKALAGIAGEPGAWVLLAVQLAYHEIRGQLSQIYETLPLLTFRQGRSESIRCLSSESVRCISALRSANQPMEAVPQKPSVLLHQIRLACARYTQKRQLARVGEGSERHLFALFLMRNRAQIPSEFLSRVLRHLRWKVHCREHLPSLSLLKYSSQNHEPRLKTDVLEQRDNTCIPERRGFPRGRNQGTASHLSSIESGILTVPPLSSDGYGISFCFQQVGGKVVSDTTITPSMPTVDDLFSVPLPSIGTSNRMTRNDLGREEENVCLPYERATCSSRSEESIDIVVTCYRSSIDNQGPPSNAKAFACCVHKWLRVMGEIVGEASSEDECRQTMST